MIEGLSMKQGILPTRAQKNILKRFGFNPDEWLISKNTTEELVIVSRYVNQHRTIPKSLINS